MTLFDELEHAFRRDVPSLTFPPLQPLLRNPSTCLTFALQELAKTSPKPLVLLIDEADVMQGEAMVSFLTQLRKGYIDRAKTAFPHSVALVGMKHIRDYVLEQEGPTAVSWLGTSSPVQYLC